MTRRRIHSSIKLLEAAGKLPPELRCTIHRSQLWRYRKMSPQDFYGAALTVEAGDDSVLLARLEEYQLLKAFVFGLLWLLDLIQEIVVLLAFEHMVLADKLYTFVGSRWSSQLRLLKRVEPVEEVLASGVNCCSETPNLRLPLIRMKSDTPEEEKPHRYEIDSS